MNGQAVEMVLAILVGIGLVTVGMVIYFAFHEPRQDPQRQYLSPEQQARVSPALSKVPAPQPALAAPGPTPEQAEANAIRQHQQLAQQYREFIDEIYDFGEHIARRHEDQS